MGTSKQIANNVCADFSNCLKILRLMLDNEASKEDEIYMMSHIEKCMFCFEQYQVEKQIRALIKSKTASIPVPADLINEIRNKISQST